MASDAEKIVLAFCDAWNRGNLDELMSFFADDAIYHNVPVPEVKGKENIRAAFIQFAQHMDGIELIMLNSGNDGGETVFNERIDRFTIKGSGKKLDLPVAGIFKVKNGKIVLHKDYFDYGTWKNATGISLDMEKGT